MAHPSTLADAEEQPKPIVSPASLADLAEWTEMRAQLWPEMSEPEQGMELEELLEQDRYCGWIARLDGKPVGFAEASLRPYANGCEGRPVPFLEGVWVPPDRRNSGIGKALVRAVEAWAIALGYSELGSDVDIANLISQAAHQAWGFDERETVVYYRRRLQR
ncbi:MAG: GNAT family N-acetyltransferase [Kiloniellales bacterium]